MISLEDYLKNPCGTLSIPYWKNRNITILPNMKIVHDSQFREEQLLLYTDEMYFRLMHTLHHIEIPVLDDYVIKTATLKEIPLFVDIINRSYIDLAVSEEQMLGYIQQKVYDKSLWIIVVDKETSLAVGCGIAEFDIETLEGSLEWIQVLPEYRGKKVGQLIVCELLMRLKDKAKFVTVSGKVNNMTKPELLYRKCGFVGHDIWHIMTQK